VIQIKTTGLEDYLDGDGGTANVKCLILGRPGSGKTRGASFWKRPLLIDFEDGRAVLADRNIPYIRVRSIKDSKDALTYIKKEVGKPSRIFDTVVVDTVDGFQITSTRERLAKVGRERLEAFEGDYDAVNNPIKEFIQGLLELDVNVVVNVHIKEAGQVKVKNAPEKAKLGEDTISMTQAWSLDLVGGLREQVPGWFDLVGLMENEWGVEGGQKVIKRHIRWQPTPEIPFLKDRLYAFGRKTPVKFADSDYTQLAEAIAAKAKGLKPSEAVAEIATEGVQPAPADIPSGPVNADPSGVLPKPRTRKAEPAPEPTPEPAVEPVPAATPEPTEDEAVATVEEVLGGQVIAVQAEARDYAAEAEQATTRAEVKAVWNAALEAGALTPALKARLTVIGKSLSQ
jgi:hypothetical protein